MPTAAQYGMTTPVGTDLVRDGDNAITQNANAAAAVFTRLEGGDVDPQSLADNADLLSLGTGWYFCRLTSTAATITNRPPGIGDSPFVVRMVRTSFGHSTITYYGYSGSANGVYENHTANSTHTTWVGWRRLDNETVGASGLAGVANALRVQEFRDAMGTVNTNGRGAIALRFDHGLANFNTKIRPLLEARNIPYSLALSARNFNAGENAGVTAAMVNGWTLAEVWNHGANQHQDESSVSGLTDQIVKGKEELQAALPSKKIWGYAVPGTGGTGQGGFNSGSTVEEFYTTLAGDLILTNHAVSSGYFPGTARRPLDGEVRQGMAHFTIEAQTVSRIKLEIDNAISNKTGNQLMMHPSLLDTSGYLTTAQLTEVLDYIKAKQDSGELIVLSPYQMMVADKGNLSELDTGWRNLTALANSGVTLTNFFARRAGNLVHISCQVAASGTAGNITLLDMPAGFVPSAKALRVGTASDRDGTSVRRISPYLSGIRILAMEAGKNYEFGISYITDDAWPTVLPGTPA
ncbi:minor tail protein [Arthrobacter phage MooKitty]|nr:minor tail protein [Arthrobacter phage MooKitty]